MHLITAEKLAELTKLSKASIDHYVDMGLLNIVQKKGTIRLFERNPSLKRIEEIQGLLSQGLYLKQIKRQIVNHNYQTNSLTNVGHQLKFNRIKMFFERKAIRKIVLLSAAIAIFYLGRATGGR